MKAALLQRVAALKLPPNFLDQLIDSLSGPKKVAEMTGRRGRVVRDSRGHGTFQLRAKPDSSEMDSLNVKEAGALSGLCALLVDFVRTLLPQNRNLRAWSLQACRDSLLGSFAHVRPCNLACFFCFSSHVQGPANLYKNFVLVIR